MCIRTNTTTLFWSHGDMRSIHHQVTPLPLERVVSPHGHEGEGVTGNTDSPHGHLYSNGKNIIFPRLGFVTIRQKNRLSKIRWFVMETLAWVNSFPIIYGCNVWIQPINWKIWLCWTKYVVYKTHMLTSSRWWGICGVIKACRPMTRHFIIAFVTASTSKRQSLKWAISLTVKRWRGALLIYWLGGVVMEVNRDYMFSPSRVV